MAVLDSCPKHNMVAYLEKSDGNVEFHEIIDFLKRSSIHFALTVSPTVSTTFVEQFWTSAKSKTINNVRHITAKVVGNSVSISKASIRSDLRFDDADGIDTLPNQAIFNAIQQMGYEGDLTVLTLNKALFSPQWRMRVLDFFSKDHRSSTYLPLPAPHKNFDEEPSEVIQSSDKSFQGMRVNDFQETAQSEGMTREMVNEDKEIDEKILSTEDVLSTDKQGVSTDFEKVSIDRPIVSTDGSKVSTDRLIEGTDEHVEGTEEHNEGTEEKNEGTEEIFKGTEEQREGTEEKVESTDGQIKSTKDQTEEEIATQATQTSTQTPTSMIFGDDETIAKVLLNMSQAKAVSKEKEKGVELKDVEETDRPRPTSTRSLLTLKPFPKIDPKDKGKKKIEEEDESKSESDVQEEWEAEEERNRIAEENAESEALIRNFDDIKARIEVDRLLAEKLQEQEREQFTIEERAKFLHDTIAAQRNISSYYWVSDDDERLIKRMNERGVDLSKSEVIKEEIKEEVQEEDKDEESTRKRKLGTRKKIKARKRRYIQNTSEDDSDKENDELRLYLTITQDEEKEVDYEILDRKYPIKEWKTKCLGAKPQTDQAEHLEEINLNVVIRSNGHKRYFSTLMTVLSIFDREDLNAVFSTSNGLNYKMRCLKQDWKIGKWKTMPPRRLRGPVAPRGLKRAAMEQIIAKRVDEAIAEHEKNRPKPNNAEGSTNVQEGVVGLRRWLEKEEQVFEITKCAEQDKVMFAASTFEGRALTWWNGNVHTLGLNNANSIP
ncbi:hypothetical protein Tco_0793204 [Tanacetum coccineum]